MKNHAKAHGFASFKCLNEIIDIHRSSQAQSLISFPLAPLDPPPQSHPPLQAVAAHHLPPVVCSQDPPQMVALRNLRSYRNG